MLLPDHSEHAYNNTKRATPAEGYTMPWQEHPRGGPSAQQQPRIRLLSEGDLSLNDAAYQMLGAPEAVVFLVDPERHAIGLRPATRSDANAYPIRQQQGKRSYWLSATSVAKAAGFPIGPLATFTHVPREGDVFVLDRAHLVPVPRPARQQAETP
jgi:hypothetical protein